MRPVSVKSITRTQPLIFVYVLFIAAFILQRQNWVVETDIIWTAINKSIEFLLSFHLQRRLLIPDLDI